MSGPAPAATATVEAPIPYRTDPSIAGGEAAWVLFSTLALLAGAYLGLRWLKARGLVAGVAPSARATIEVIATRRLTLNTVAVVVQVDGRRALLTESTRSTAVRWLDAPVAATGAGEPPIARTPEPTP